MDEIAELKRLAGITEEIAEIFELHVFNIGNSRPFISEGASYQISEEISDLMNKDGWTKMEIHPKV